MLPFVKELVVFFLNIPVFETFMLCKWNNIDLLIFGLTGCLSCNDCRCSAAFIHIDRNAINDIWFGFSTFFSWIIVFVMQKYCVFSFFFFWKAVGLFYVFSPFVKSAALSPPQIKLSEFFILPLLNYYYFFYLNIFLHTKPRTAPFGLSWVRFFLLLYNWCCFHDRVTLTTPNCIRSPICSIPGAKHSLILASLGLNFGQCVRKGISFTLSMQFPLGRRGIPQTPHWPQISTGGESGSFTHSPGPSKSICHWSCIRLRLVMVFTYCSIPQGATMVVQIRQHKIIQSMKSFNTTKCSNPFFQYANSHLIIIKSLL